MVSITSLKLAALTYLEIIELKAEFLSITKTLVVTRGQSN
jgi:hypothetical protein